MIWWFVIKTSITQCFITLQFYTTGISDFMKLISDKDWWLVKRTLHRHSRATFSNDTPVSPISARNWVEYLMLLDGAKASVEARTPTMEKKKDWFFIGLSTCKNGVEKSMKMFCDHRGFDSLWFTLIVFNLIFFRCVVEIVAINIT